MDQLHYDDKKCDTYEREDKNRIHKNKTLYEYKAFDAKMKCITPNGSMHEKAMDMEKSAERKSKSFFGGRGKYEESGEMYSKAANFYKMDKLWMQAARAYERAAQMYEKGEAITAISEVLSQAVLCYKKVSPDDAVRILERLIGMELEAGKTIPAACLAKTLAELSEELMRPDRAIGEYQRAADLFRADESKMQSNQCLLKVAHLSALKDDFASACNIYEQLARESLDNNLTQWSAREYYFKSGLCHLAMGDPIGSRQIVQRYMEEGVKFPQTRECQLLNQILDAWDHQDTDAFTDAVYQFGQITKLDKWKTNILLKIKNSIKEGDSPV
jgi:alpha-soluble NSF attachment protein